VLATGKRTCSPHALGRRKRMRASGSNLTFVTRATRRNFAEILEPRGYHLYDFITSYTRSKRDRPRAAQQWRPSRHRDRRCWWWRCCRSRPWRPVWRPPPCSGASDQRLFECPIDRHYAGPDMRNTLSHRATLSWASWLVSLASRRRRGRSLKL